MSDRKTACIVWQNAPQNVRCQIHTGEILQVQQISDLTTRLEFVLSDDQRKDSVIFVTSSLCNFSFFPASIKSGWPMIVPAWGVAVTDETDDRSYQQILADMQALNLPKSQDQWKDAPETTFDEAAANTKPLRCLSFLGLTRDMRTFDIGFLGKLDLSVTPDSPQVHAITITLFLYNHENNSPETVYIHLPHPHKQKIRSTHLGEILADGENLQSPASALNRTVSWEVCYE